MPASKASQRLTRAARDRFLAALATGLSVTAACAAAGLCRRVAYEHRERDPAFATAWDEACEAGTDLIEDEARRRAVEGWLEPRFHKGVECGQVRRFSDQLLLATLRRRRPEAWREGVDLKHSGAVGGDETIAALEEGRRRAEAARAAAAEDEARGYAVAPIG